MLAIAEAVPLLADAARAAGARPRVIDDADVAAVPPVGLPGEHQRRNAAAAIAAIRALGLSVVEAALAGVRHPGRFEVIEPGPSGAPRIILDGAHNPQGAAALADALRERGERPVLIIGVSADKDAAAIAAALASQAPPAVRAGIATRYQQDRALDPAALAAAFAPWQASASLPVTTAPDLRAAIAAAAAHGAPIVVAGSLFLVGEARTLLLGAPTDPIVVTDPPVGTPVSATAATSSG
jgi:dihydrofolate synthase/folylpolyglutamate synthase